MAFLRQPGGNDLYSRHTVTGFLTVVLDRPTLPLMSIITILLLLAFLCFVGAAFSITARVNLIGLGLAFWVLTLLIG